MKTKKASKTNAKSRIIFFAISTAGHFVIENNIHSFK